MKQKKENRVMTPQEYVAYRLERLCPASRRRWMFGRLLDSRIVRRMA